MTQREDAPKPHSAPATTPSSGPRWATPTVEAFEISETVKGPGGTISDSTGNATHS